MREGSDIIRYSSPAGTRIAAARELRTPRGAFKGDGRSAHQIELDHPQAVARTRGTLYVAADTGAPP